VYFVTLVATDGCWKPVRGWWVAQTNAVIMHELNTHKIVKIYLNTMHMAMHHVHER